MLWYLSKAKLMALKSAPKWYEIPKNVEVTLKEPFLGAVQAKLTQKADEKREVAAALSQVKAIASVQLREFHELDSVPPLARFTGEAMRVVNREGYWLATWRDKTGLILGGATANGIGTDLESSKASLLSPSLDPVEALQSAFGQGQTGPDIPRVLSHIYATICSRSAGAQHLPTVSGVCTIAAIYSVDATVISNSLTPGLTRLVVGSPVYVEQE